MTTCAICPVEIGITHRAGARTCSARCRKAYSRLHPAAKVAARYGIPVSDMWRSPGWVVRQAAELAEVPAWDLDAAACELDHVAPMWFGSGGIVADALAVSSWAAPTPATKAGAVWCNPPYSGRGGHLAAWVAAGIRAADDGAVVVMLLPASIGSVWFGRAHLRGRVWRYPRRLAFVPPTDSPGRLGGPRHDSILDELRPDGAGAGEFVSITRESG